MFSTFPDEHMLLARELASEILDFGDMANRLRASLPPEIAALSTELLPVSDQLAELEFEARLRLLKELAEQQKNLEQHYKIIRALRSVTRPADHGVIRVPDR